MDKEKGDRGNTDLGRYKCASDLPVFIDLSTQLTGFKLLDGIIETGQSQAIADIENKLGEIIATVDGFYNLFGDRNWVFHESLNFVKLKGLLAKKPDLDAAEEWLIKLYQDEQQFKTEEWLIKLYQDEQQFKIMLLPTNRFEAMRKRSDLIAKARSDYLEGRYYSCVMLLLAIVDGFVNEFESIHKGFHARESTEFSDWGNVAAHHAGIERMHKNIYTKTISLTQEEPVYDLYRNGIMHGAILNFDNVVVASKAWNLLFSVLDWAIAKQEGERAASESAPTLQESIGEYIEFEQRREKCEKEIKKWHPYSLASNDEGFEKNEIIIACKSFLDYWSSKNYGYMAKCMPNALQSNGNALPKQVRQEYNSSDLCSYRVTRIEGTAPVLAKTTLILNVNGCEEEVVMEWMFESDTNDLAMPMLGDGEWHLRPRKVYPFSFLGAKQLPTTKLNRHL